MTPTRAARVSSLRSMTGFGRAEVSAGPVAISVEARSLSHRDLDVTLRLPRALADLEMDARRLIQSRLERGRVEIAAQLSPAPDTPGQKISVDQALAAQYIARARALGSAIGIGGGVTPPPGAAGPRPGRPGGRSEENTPEIPSHTNIICPLLPCKKKKKPTHASSAI